MNGAESSQDEVRQIVNSARTALFARGWHCLGPADKFTSSAPHVLKAFGQELVIDSIPGSSVQIRNARCLLAAPSHSVSPAGEATCQVRNTRATPTRHEAPCWPILEQDGLLFIWNDPEGNPPIAQQAIPRILEAASGQWSQWAWNELVVKASPRDVIEHIADTARFFYANTNRPTFFKNVFEAHVATQYFDGPMQADYTRRNTQEVPEPLIWTNSAASYFGPAFMIDELDYVHENHDVSAILINAHYPIDEHHLALLSGVLVKKNDVPSTDPQAFAADQAARISHGFSMDSSIWQQKTYLHNPLLCEEDGPVYQLRRWYEQFFIKVDQVQPEMTDRFEYEMDTTMSKESWQKSLGRTFNASRKPTGKQLA